MTEYVYAEPEIATRSVYIDAKGKSHDNRDAAILENIKADAATYIATQLVRAWPDDADERMLMARALVYQITSHQNKFRGVIRALIDAS